MICCYSNLPFVYSRRCTCRGGHIQKNSLIIALFNRCFAVCHSGFYGKKGVRRTTADQIRVAGLIGFYIVLIVFMEYFHAICRNNRIAADQVRNRDIVAIYRVPGIKQKLDRLGFVLCHLYLQYRLLCCGRRNLTFVILQIFDAGRLCPQNQPVVAFYCLLSICAGT